MTKAEFLAILDRHLDGTATDRERRLLDDFYRHHLAPPTEEWAFTDKERVRIEIFESLNRAIDEDARQHQRTRTSSMWWVAASIVILFAAGLGLYLARIAPPEIQYVTTTTQRGERTTVTLQDGSVVRLNAESSITFPEDFTSLESRDIQLSGEAFFDVARDEAKPFIIRSGDLVTTVLGTSFNVRAYPEDDMISVTVATGKVSIEAASDPQERDSQVLISGQQGLYDRLSSKIAKSDVNLEKYLAWKDGTILLEGTSLKEATDILGRWYDVQFVFENPDLATCTIDGKFRNDKLGNILENLRFLLGIEYRMEAGNKIIIDGKSCH